MSVKHMVDTALEALKNGNVEAAEEQLKKAQSFFENRSYLVFNDNEFYHPRKINRVEVIDHNLEENARAYVTHQAQGVDVSIQDDGRTAKIFIPRVKKHWTEEAKERSTDEYVY